MVRRLAEAGLSLDLKGLEHGTVATVVEGVSVEVTTFRKDVVTDGRRARVAWASLEEGLARRDFTVNAMALTRQGRLIDPFGGQRDLEARQVRAVGDPARRFQEDRLRVVRPARFGSLPGWGGGGEYLGGGPQGGPKGSSVGEPPPHGAGTHQGASQGAGALPAGPARTRPPLHPLP